MPSTPDPDRLDLVIESWEHQQDAYVNNRAGRFTVALDALSYARPALTTVVDLAAGPGSFGKLVLQRFPQAHVVAVDYDPALLQLARHNLREFGDRARVVEANLLDPAWTRALGPDRPDAFVSSTALHWLPTGRLVTLYEEVAGLLGDGGVFVNADHLSQAGGRPFFQAVSEADDAGQQSAAFGLRDAGVGRLVAGPTGGAGLRRPRGRARPSVRRIGEASRHEPGLPHRGAARRRLHGDRNPLAALRRLRRLRRQVGPVTRPTRATAPRARHARPRRPAAGRAGR